MRAVALKTIYFTDEKTGQRKKALARGNGHHGVFSGLTSEQYDKLESLQAVRKPTKGEIAEAGEDHEADRVVVLEEAPKPARTTTRVKPADEPKTGTKGKDSDGDDSNSGSAGNESVAGTSGNDSVAGTSGGNDLVG